MCVERKRKPTIHKTDPACAPMLVPFHFTCHCLCWARRGLEHHFPPHQQFPDHLLHIGRVHPSLHLHCQHLVYVASNHLPHIEARLQKRQHIARCPGDARVGMVFVLALPPPPQHLAGLVVKVCALRAEDPGFDSRLCWVQSYR